MTDALTTFLTRLTPEKRHALAEMLRPAAEPIAIVGMACRFPGDSSTPEAFWEMLRDGRDGIVTIPPERWDVDAYYDPDPAAPGKMYSRTGGVLRQAARFDASFFGISPHEAQRMDPQQRLLLEVSWEALERAGLSPDRLAGSEAGVFVGVIDNLYKQLQIQSSAGSVDDPYFLIGSACSATVGRLSYLLDLRGPNVAIDTACSSSLVAIHLACQSLRGRECQVALAGGVGVLTMPEVLVTMCKMQMLSRTGYCHTFDAAADGFVFGEGCGMVVLKRLADAQADGDPILAIIRGSAVNEDGRSTSLTAPNGQAQQAVIRRALAMAEVPPHLVSYVEAHGTGTPLGDPIEIEALQSVLRAGRAPGQKVRVGAVKSNIGHLAAGAGVAGVIKTVLALQNRQIPPTAHVSRLNPTIAWDHERLEVPTQVMPWEAVEGRRVAGVSSFGWSGTNAHVVLEEAPPRVIRTPTQGFFVLPFSAQSDTALEQVGVRLQAVLGAAPALPIADVAWTLQRGRAALPYRRALVAADGGQAAAVLEAGEQVWSSHVPPGQRMAVAFLLPGVGDHYANMGRDVYACEPVFREVVERCCTYLQPLVGEDLRALIYPDGAPVVMGSGVDLRRMLGRGGAAEVSPLRRTDLGQPATFVVSYALACLLQSWGIQPQALLGYSLGEYVAACLAGVMTLEDALRLVALRARLIHGLPEGRMLAVPLDQLAIQSFLAPDVTLAVVNGPQSCVLAGTPDGIAQAQERLNGAGIVNRVLETSHAFHSPLLEPIVGDFQALLGSITLNPPRIPFLSNVSGTWITPEQATSAAYWTAHMCQTVRFGDGLDVLLGKSSMMLLEVGPGQSLSSFARQHPRCGAEQRGRVVATMRSVHDRQDDRAVLQGALARLWLGGVVLDWGRIAGDGRGEVVDLPTYPFEGRDYWFTPVPQQAAIAPVLARRAAIGDWFYELVWEEQPLVVARGVDAERWLIVDGGSGFGSALVPLLHDAGAAVEYARVGMAGLRVDSVADYRALFGQLEQHGLYPTQVVYVAALDEPTGVGAEGFDAAQLYGCFGVLALVQALAAQPGARAVQISVVADRLFAVGEQVPDPARAPLLGLARVIPQENPFLRCRLIDVGAVAQRDERVPSWVLAEVMQADGAPVAYQGGQRLVGSFRARHLEEQPAPLRERGVYAITGGLGGVGLAIAEYVARHAQARLALLGRSGLPDRAQWEAWLASHATDDVTSERIRRVVALEQAGAEVLVVQADVSDLEQMRAAFAQVMQHFGALHGVVHAAGTLDAGKFRSLRDLTPDVWAAHFAPKAHGSLALATVLEGVPLDFCALLSSLSTVLGGLGFGAYAAANSVLDAMALVHRAEHWQSVCWDVWDVASTRQAGMASSSLDQYRMTTEEGTRAFAVALASGVPYLVNSTGDLLARMRQWGGGAMGGQGATPSPVQQVRRVGYVPVGNDHERRLAAIWQAELGLEQIGANDNFFELGGNSLLAMRVTQRIQEEFGVTIPGVTLFEAPTVRTMAALLRPPIVAVPDAAKQRLVDRRGQARRATSEHDIAVIGLAGRFPGAPDVATFWRNLCDGVESIRFFSDEELLAAGVDPALLRDEHYVRARPILDDVDRFDAAFFGYNPREAELLDPQTRIFLECAWEALEDAGYAPRRYAGLIGVFAGASISTYLLSWYRDPQQAAAVNDYQIAMSGDKDALTTTVSYRLDLRGPSFAVQTFCSTSLVAAHVACQSLISGECDVALAGGVSLRVPTVSGYRYQPGGMESPDGHCRPFDAGGHGTLFGDGAGIVVLKRLSEALEDGDQVYAVIKGSAVNNDGALKVGYTAPSVNGQVEAVQMALEHAKVDPASIGFVEAHGSATEMGDPIEVTALTRAFAEGGVRPGTCAIGSVKSNIGHLERAAGVAGLIKAVLAVRHGVIPPSLNFDSPNPQIDFANSPFFVNTSLCSWPLAGVRRAGVSSLGMGGTNAHVVVEEPPVVPPSGPARPWQLVALSAASESALTQMTRNIGRFLEEHPDVPLADVAYTLQVGREALPWRRVLVCKDQADACAGLVDARRLMTYQSGDRPAEVAFLFPGVGDHYPQVARGLYEHEPVFRAAFDACASLLRPVLEADLGALLFPDEPAPVEQGEALDFRALVRRGAPARSAAAQRLAETAVAQPVVFAIEYALAQLLMAWGVHPTAMIGYSVGEYVAACLAGVLSLEDALMVVAQRARLIQGLPAGRMLAVNLAEEQLMPLLCDGVVVAVRNGADAYVLGGPVAAIEEMQARFAGRDIACRLLETTHAFHTPMMHPIAAQFADVLGRVRLNPPQIPYLSNVTGTWITDEQAMDAGYWIAHMEQTVRFYEGLDALLQEPDVVLVEVGPGQALNSFARQHPRCTSDQAQRVVSTIRYEYVRQDDCAFLLSGLGRLWLLGASPDWASFSAHERRLRVALPTYPFERQRYWIEGKGVPLVAAQGWRPDSDASPLALVESLPRQSFDSWFSVPIWQQTAPLPPARLPSVPARWVIFSDVCGVGAHIAARLVAEGQRVALVEPGAAMARVGEDRYTVRPTEREDYEAVLMQVQGDSEPLRIVHLWGVAPLERGADAPAQRLAQGFTSLIGLAQALGGLEPADCAVMVVASGMYAVTGGEALEPLHVTLTGPCQMIPLEYPRIRCRCVDLGVSAPDYRPSAVLMDTLWTEIVSDASEPLVALRGRQRWVQGFDLLRRAEATEAAVRAGGVYVITGGLGGVGLAIAEELASRAPVRLVLVGRTGLPSRELWEALPDSVDQRRREVVQQVVQLESLGAEVLVLAADVTDEVAMRAVVAQTRARFGPINGVVHAAGVPGGGLIQLKTAAASDAVLGPKVYGTLVLERVLRDEPLDFLVLFSSISAMTGGGPGQADYCAANAFLDAFAQAHSTSARPIVAINWCEWQWNAWEAGMQGYALPVQDFFRRSRERFGLSFAEGRAAFVHVLAQGLPQVVVSTQAIAALVEAGRRFSVLVLRDWAAGPPDQRGSYARPALGVSYVAPRTDLERSIAAVWSEILRISEVGVYDNFFDLGGNSLIGLDLVSRLQQALQRKLPPHMLYEAPSVSEMAKFLSDDGQNQEALVERSDRGLRRRQAHDQRRSRSGESRG